MIRERIGTYEWRQGDQQVKQSRMSMSMLDRVAVLFIVGGCIVHALPCSNVEPCVGVNQTCADAGQQCSQGVCRKSDSRTTLELEGHRTLPPNRVQALIRVAQDGMPRTSNLALSMFDVREDDIPLSDDSDLQFVPDAIQVAIHFLFHRSHTIGVTYAEWQPELTDAVEQLRSIWPSANIRVSSFSGADTTTMVWNGTGALPDDLDDRSPLDTSTNLHGALMDVMQQLRAASEHVRVLVLWTDDVDRADRVSARAVQQLACDTQPWIFLLDIHRLGLQTRLPHAWIPPPEHGQDAATACMAVDDMQASSILGLGGFWTNAITRLRLLATDLVVLTYASASRDHTHRTTIRLLDDDIGAGGEIAFEFDARGFTGQEDPLCAWCSTPGLPSEHHLPACARPPVTEPRDTSTIVDNTVWIVTVATTVTIAGLYLIWLIVLLVRDRRKHGAWTLLPQTSS